MSITATHILMIGSEGTYDFNTDPEGKVYQDRARSNAGTDHGAKLVAAKEYPVGSGQVLACGGINGQDLSLRGCERCCYHCWYCCMLM